MCPAGQWRPGRRSCGSVWYQTTETLRLSPAAIHGQSTRVPGFATVTGADHVLPRSFVEIIMIEFAAGVGPPLQPPPVPAPPVVPSPPTDTPPALSLPHPRPSASTHAPPGPPRCLALPP